MPRGLAKIDGADQVHADIALGVPTANREDQPRSQPLNTVPHSSSFVQAVNSETSSTGEYAKRWIAALSIAAEMRPMASKNCATCSVMDEDTRAIAVAAASHIAQVLQRGNR